jgi:SpoVK/Ycf46/Vps4 family AAA+-type ATPase
MLVARWSALADESDSDGSVATALDRAAAQFHLTATAADDVVENIRALASSERAGAAWRLAREAARGGLESVAQRIVTRIDFSDLVLPSAHLSTLRDIARHLKHRDRVLGEWGFGDKHSRGHGMTALFAGESGTGKTLAAEAIANEAGLDLYRVDLATLVSKYIGETEKNLKRLFDAAEASGTVLLFDEADALFGKRSEVKDSHDRYANIEVAYLLQRVEAYRGLAILTTNMKSALDRAFLRRIRFVVNFPFPDVTAREQIWRRQFPPRAPLSDVDFKVLAKLNLPGGNINSIALNAAFKAADGDTPIDQATLMSAARAEFAKLERSMGDAAARSAG